MTMTDKSFSFLADFLKKNSGYYLQPEKRYLLEARLESVLKNHKFSDAEKLVEVLHRDPHGHIGNDVIEAMTVNETFFFRDQSPFERFEKELLPRLIEAAENRPFRIWSAACSTGQEPYSLAMILEDQKKRYPTLSYEIIATDINNTVLARARKGVFSDLEINRGLPGYYRDKFFNRREGTWTILQGIRNKITFRQLNLREPFNVPGHFDFVLLRNVLIYFDAELKESVLQKVSRVLRPEGYLLLGAAEGIYDPEHYFQRCSEVKGLYRYAHALK